MIGSHETTTGPACFFDISGVLGYVSRFGRVSGIQRVVVTLIVEYARLAGQERLYLSWYDKRKSTYCCVGYADVGEQAFASPTDMLAAFHPGRARRPAPEMLGKYRTQPLKYYTKRAWFDLAAALGKDRYFRKYDMTAEMWRKLRRQKAQPIARMVTPRPIAEVARKGDRLVLLDASWSPEHTDVFARLKSDGLDVVSMVYDLIPIVAPEICEGNMPVTFYDWVLRSTEYTSRYMTISHAVRHDLLNFFAAHAIDLPVTAVPLAQARLPRSPALASEMTEGPLARKVAGEAYPQFKAVMRIEDKLRHLLGSPFVLCVGTLEARKNIWRITLAWKRLLDQGHTDLPKLVFAGRRGWLIQDFEDLLAATGNLYGYVHIVEAPSDMELELLYQRCQFVIMASLHEGWGLPVGEALAYGKTAVVADNSSLPEVGGQLVEYCDALSVSSISDAVSRLNNPTYREELEARIADHELRSWSSVARDMQAVIWGHSADAPSERSDG